MPGDHPEGGVDDCVSRVLRDNPGMDESRAFAICNAQQNANIEEVATLADLDLEAEAMDDLAAESDEWTAYEASWVNEAEGLAVLDAPQQAEFDFHDLALVEALIGHYADGGGEPDDPVTQFLDRLDDATDLEVEDVDDVFAAFLEEAGAESLEEATVGELDEWAGGVADGQLGVEVNDEDQIVLSGLSTEALEDIQRRYNVDVVAGGEATAAPAGSQTD